MMERNDEVPQGEEGARERTRILEQTFHLSPETARVTAEDSVSDGMRNPGSDDVDEEREAGTHDAASTGKTGTTS